MSANLRFVADAAETDADEFPAERVGDRLAKAGLADSGRAEKTEDRSMPLRIEFAHGEIFDQPPLHFFEIVMVAIENLLGLVEIEIVLAHFRPGQIGDGLDVADDDGIFRAGRRNEIEPLQFALGLGHDLRRRLRFFERLRNCATCSSVPVSPSPSSRLDRLDLLAQISAALRVGELRLHILLQLLLDLRDLELRRDAVSAPRGPASRHRVLPESPVSARHR